MSITQSVVLCCAGIGSRLGLGQTKALVEILGKSVIGWQMELFAEVKDLRIVIGFQAKEVVKEVLRYRDDVIFIFNHKYFTTKTGASYFLGGQHANKLVVEWDGDLLVHPDDAKNLLSLEEEYIAYSDIKSDEPVFVDINPDGDVIGFSRLQGQYEWSGPCCLYRDKLQSYGPDVYNILEPQLPIKGIKIRAQDIDTYNDYKQAELFIRSW